MDKVYSGATPRAAVLFMCMRLEIYGHNITLRPMLLVWALMPPA
jgi:hypothetical protein